MSSIMTESAKLPRRRQFFRESVRSVLRPLADYLDRRLGSKGSRPRAWLRPPGALAEAAFLETCFRCGNCVAACPAQAIRPLESTDDVLRNTPIIVPDLAACVVCDELACMKVCPSGALKLVDSPLLIRMGLAVVDHSVCVRSSGEDCMICVDRCPLGAQAIRVDELRRIQVLQPGCVGCGVCQLYCPTQPKAITVEAL